MKMRRSRSAEGRYCVRKDADSVNSKSKACDSDNEGACGGSYSTTNSCSTSRRNSCANTLTTQVPALKYDLLNKRRRSNASRASDMPLRTWIDQNQKKDKEPSDRVDQEENATLDKNLPNITIEIVDEND